MYSELRINTGSALKLALSSGGANDYHSYFMQASMAVEGYLRAIPAKNRLL